MTNMSCAIRDRVEKRFALLFQYSRTSTPSGSPGNPKKIFNSLEVLYIASELSDKDDNNPSDDWVLLNLKIKKIES